MPRENRSASREVPARPAGAAPVPAGPAAGKHDGPARSFGRLILPAALGAAVAAAVLAAHWTALDARALSFDDPEYFLNNVLVQTPSWETAGRFLTEVSNPSSVRGYYQPLNMISLMLDCAMGASPENLLPLHRTSLILHTANAVLVMVVLYLLLDNLWAAAAAALIFGLHPMTVETLAWVGERKTLLAAFFALWSLVFYLRYARASRPQRADSGPARRTRWPPLAVSVAAYLLAVMSKPTALLLPIVMLVMDFWPLGRMDRSGGLRAGKAGTAPPPLPDSLLQRIVKLVLEKVPFFLIMGVSAVVTYISQGKLYAETRTPLQALFIFCHNIVFYPFKMLWPANLTSHYHPPPLLIGTFSIQAGIIGTVLLAAGLIVSLRWTRSLAAGWAIFLVAIFPTMGVIGFSNVIASDKFAYLPVLGLLMVLVYLLDWLGLGHAAAPAHARPAKAAAGKRPVEAGPSAEAKPAPAWKQVLIGAAVVALASGEAVLTRRYLSHWTDSITLYRYMLAYAPESPEIQNNLGGFLESKGDDLLMQAGTEQAAGKRDEGLADAREAVACLREARGYLAEAIRLHPTMLGSHMNLGRAIFDEAQAAFVIAGQEADVDPNNPQKIRQAVLAFERRAQARQDAEALLLHSMALNPGDYRAAYNMGRMVFDYDNRQADLAIGWFQKSLEINPRYMRAHLDLAGILEVRGRPGDLAEAYRHLLTVQQIKPGDQGIAQGLRNFRARHPDLR
jgi:tetratricopeptide (TPR) repeat protein